MWLLASDINLIKRRQYNYKDDTFQFSLLSTLINCKRHYFSHGDMDQLKNLFFISLTFIISIHTDIRAIRQQYYLSNSDLIALFCKYLRYYLSHGDLIAFIQFSEKEVGYDYHRSLCFIRVALLCKNVKVYVMELHPWNCWLRRWILWGEMFSAPIPGLFCGSNKNINIYHLFSLWIDHYFWTRR